SVRGRGGTYVPPACPLLLEGVGHLPVPHTPPHSSGCHPMTGISSLVEPHSIAVVGASPRNVAAVETVVESGVRAWGVNPNRDEVAGLPCYPTVAELPAVPECAFLMVNHERVESAFEEAAAAGVRAFVVPGVGAEAGTAARPTTERLARRARELGVAMLGPNCMGIYVPGGAAAWNGRP